MININWFDRALPPVHAVPKASSFSDWVFRASNEIQSQETEASDYRKKRMEQGKIDHKLIENFMQSNWVESSIGIGSASNWKLTFADDGRGSIKIFRASRLTVKGKPLRCVPDAVLHNEVTNTFMVIERKTTRRLEPQIPTNGWPNVQAQLWCYSWIDDWIDAQEVLLVGQLWRRTINRGKILCKSHSLWKRSNESHQENCAKWFERYGGKIGEL